MKNPGTTDSRLPMRWAIASCVLLCLAGVFSIELAGHMPGKTAGSSVSSRAVISQSETRSPRPLKSGISASAVLASHAEIVNRYGKLPMSFEPNVGQSGDPVKFLAHGNAYTLFLTPSEAVFALKSAARTRRQTQPKTSSISTTPTNVPNSRFQAKNSRFEILRMRLVGANPAPLLRRTRRTAREEQLFHRQPAREVAHEYSQLPQGCGTWSLSGRRSSLLRHAATARIRFQRRTWR